MKKLTRKQKQWLKDEARSVATSVLAFFVVDAGAELTKIYDGDFSEVSWMFLGAALLRSVMKVMLEVSFPKLFPARRSSNRKDDDSE